MHTYIHTHIYVYIKKSDGEDVWCANVAQLYSKLEEMIKSQRY